MKFLHTLAVLLFISLWSIQPIKAQSTVYVGGKVIPQNTWLLNKDDMDEGPSFDYVPTINVAFGATAGYNFSRHWGAGTSLLYSMQGQKYESNGVELNRKVNYLKVPFFIFINSNPDAGVMFLGKFGAQFGLMLSSKMEDGMGNDYSSAGGEDFFATFDQGLMLGLGLQFRLQDNLLLSTGLRFDSSIKNAENDDYPLRTVYRPDTYNATAGFEIGLKYVIEHTRKTF